MLELNKIYNIDCMDGLKLLDNNTIDLIVTSPPYNVDLGNNKFNNNKYDTYNDNKDYHEYLSWLKSIFEIAYDKLKIGGRCCINIGSQNNGAIPTHSDITQFMIHDLKYQMYSTIIWDKHQVNNRTAWGSFQSPSCPSFPTPFEFILIFYKESKSLIHRSESDLTKQEFIDYSYGIWNIAPESNMKSYGHPAMFPIELPYRLIKMLSYPQDLIVDIFGGLGTTAVAAKKTNRNYILFEISENYCNAANNRIENYKVAKQLF